MASDAYSRTRTLGWLLAGAGALLLTVVIGFVAMAHRKASHFLAGLPRHLGANIQQETNGFTYDQSKGKRKIFTVHASKEAQMRDGRIALHDVGITLYGPSGQPADRIHGQDFEFDTKAQTMSAQGEVYIDLVPPAKQEEQPEKGDPEARMVHVKTFGLLFLQKEQMASTEGAVEFRTGGYAGNAVGASYDARRGVVVLKSAVRMSGLRNDRPVVLTASRAQMDRATNLINLQHAKYVSAGEMGTESVEAGHAMVHTQPDGTPRHVDAEGSVTLSGSSRGTITSDRMQMDLGTQGQAQSAHLFGNVRYANEEPAKNEQGHAQEARVAFDAAGHPQHAFMTGGVSLVEKGPTSGRTLDAANVEIGLGGGGRTPTIIRSAAAYGAGGARLQLADQDLKGRSLTDVHADRLTGRFVAGAKGSELAGLDGDGHSVVVRTAFTAQGAPLSKDTSSGDVLHIDFKPGAAGRSELTRAAQSGAVSTVHEEAARAGAERQVEHARAHDAVFEAAANVLHLIGAAAVEDPASALYADRIDLDRGTGDATAFGRVRVTYQNLSAGAGSPDASSEPVHLLAARGVLHKSSGLAEFSAGPGQRVRMWQGASQVEAPVIDLDRKGKRLVAHGEAGVDGLNAVRTVLNGAAGGDGSEGQNQRQGPLRIFSRQLIYADGARTIDFTGDVRVESRDGIMRSRQATVWLSPVAAGASRTSVDGLMGGRVDHMITSGGVQLDQPGRRGTGEKLVYTASDGAFLLTGTPSAPPRVDDQVQGSTTGSALRFKTGDRTVEVLGAAAGGAIKTAGRVRSETRIK